MPSIRLDKSSWHHIKALQLADPNCHKPGPVDLLIGAECFASLLLPGSIKGDSNQPSALNSVFGWLLVGNVGYVEPEAYSFFVHEVPQLHDELKKLWQLEEFNVFPSKPLTVEDERCEQIFKDLQVRDPAGRYIVSLPFRNEEHETTFPGSRDTALRCFHSIEKRLLKNMELYEKYCDFMKEYLDQGHMSLVPTEELSIGKYFIPHHFVLRTESSTTPLRVVFNASAKDARGLSLNDVLLVGPKLQMNIVEILLKFRVHAVVFTADMKQMYRQILIRASDRDYQRIFWRSNVDQPVQEYRLNTVTYGVSSAPFLACRTVKQLIHDEGGDFPLTSQVLGSDVYVDDIITGFSNVRMAQNAKTQIIELLKRDISNSENGLVMYLSYSLIYHENIA
ncbi:uncharacterized protein LOC119190452 [Manduca sexta]|uniref:uncharacterized protein LOC119190452 n=1 Tax=Manduca sexta TaxID=7130 RepID=UPI00188DD60F|nr:uncharacterized protein LOC119190452 [Manduca sexta]